MRNLFAGGLLFILCCFYIPAQETQTRLDSYTRNFEKASSLEIKLKVLQNSMKTGIQDMGPLYLMAIIFVNDNASVLETDALIRQIALLAIDLVQEVGYKPAGASLWKLFNNSKDTILKSNILIALGVVAHGETGIAVSLSDWLSWQNSFFASGIMPDLSVLAEAVKTLGALKSSTAFPVLFKTKTLGYSEQIDRLAEEALYELDGNLKENFMEILQKENASKKYQALQMALKSERLSDYEKAQLAETGLEVAMHNMTEDAAEQQTARDLRVLAIRTLSKLKWARATDLAIEHLGRTILEHDRELVNKSYLLEAIDGLGNMGTHEAAKRLTLYLELLNTYTEHGSKSDEQIVTSVIYNLKNLGDKIAFENLSYVGYLDYSKEVKKKALEAIDNLKW